MIVRALVLLSGLSLGAGLLHATEVRYVRDTLYVPLRSGPSDQHRILHKGLVSGTSMELLETQEDSEWVRVRLSNGTEGWIRDQYLVDSPIARTRLDAVQEQLSQSERLRTQSMSRQQELEEQLQQLQKQVQGTSSQNQELQQQYTELKRISGGALDLDRQNKSLHQENQMLRSELDMALADNRRLTESHENEAYLNGALSVLLGVIIAVLLPRLRQQRRSEWR